MFLLFHLLFSQTVVNSFKKTLDPWNERLWETTIFKLRKHNSFSVFVSCFKLMLGYLLESLVGAILINIQMNKIVFFFFLN